MACGTDLNVQRLAVGGTCLELIAATARHLDFSVIRVDAFFHIDVLGYCCPWIWRAGKARIILETDEVCKSGWEGG